MPIPPAVEPVLAAPPSPGVVRPRPGRLLGDVLVALGFVDREGVEAAVAEARDCAQPMGRVLLRRGTVTADELAIAVAERFGLEHLRLDAAEVDIAAAQLVPAATARRLRAVPVRYIDAGTLLVAMVNPSNVLAIDDLAMLTDLRVHAAVVSEEDLDALLARLSRVDGGLTAETPDDEHDAEEEDDLRESADDTPTVRLVRSLIAQGVDQGASDIHFDPEEGGLVVRLRIDGVMADASRVPRRMAAKVISRLKILAELDIAERRLPQDGRVGLTLDDRRIDLRVTVVPLVGGESVVLRVLDPGRAPLTLDELGMAADDRERLVGALARPHGAILATGPTGSGKSTSLYASVALVRSPEKTLMTIEDPVESRLPGVKQVQVSERTGLTFARGLRSIVRADPDIVMVGEMRDPESARIAIEAALTGHLLLSTLHTNDAPSAPARLVDMGVEPYLVAASLECVVAQRLARRLCTSCRRPAGELFEPGGCARCRHTGYRGRLGLYEVMVVDDEIRSLIVRRAPVSDIAAHAAGQGMRRLREDGLAKAREGLTSLAEVARVTG